MRLRMLGSVLIGLAAVAPVSAQKSSPISVSRGEFSVAPYGGYLITQKFFDGPLNSSLGVSSAPVYGVQASLPLAPSSSLVGTLGYASGDLEVGVPILGGLDVGTTDTWIFDAAVELRGSFGRFMPLAQLGAGAIHRRLSVYGVDAKTTDFTVSGGLGADFPVTSNVALRVLARDYFGKADFGTLGPLEAKTKDIHAIALSAGVRLAF